jgi:transcriptional regulator GlxA family with amidase domain
MARAMDANTGVVISSSRFKDLSIERRVRKILELVEAGTTFAVCDLAAEIHVSETHLQRLFMQDTGFHLGKWLREQRLERSAYLLTCTSLSVKQIAHAVGYEHLSSFTRAFERQFMLPPAHLRKQVQRTGDAKQTIPAKSA